MIEIGEDNPDLAWVHSSWDRWSEKILSLDEFRTLRNREGLIIGTLPSGRVSFSEEIPSAWEEEMFKAEVAALPAPEIDLELPVSPEEQTTVLRIGGERPFWIEIETESPFWMGRLLDNNWAVRVSMTPGGHRERWLLPHSLLELG